MFSFERIDCGYSGSATVSIDATKHDSLSDDEEEQACGAFNLTFPQLYPVLVDNQSAIALACGPGSHYQRTKHTAAKKHFQRQLFLEGVVVRYQHQATHVQIADYDD